MKLSLDQLSVESYAMQVSEVELTKVKGGDGEDSTPVCIYLGAAAIAAVATIVVAVVSSPSPPKSTTTTTVHYGPGGNMVDSTVHTVVNH